MQILSKLFAPRLNSLSFTDWVNRINDTLTNSYAEVEKSSREDTFENVLEAFKKNSANLLNGIDGVDVFVDIYGVFLYNEFSDKKVYVLSFDKNGRFTNLPTEASFTRITAKKHLTGILTREYRHHLSKLESRESRLKAELSEVSELKKLIEKKISKVGVKSDEESGPYKFDTLETFIERNTTPNTGTASVVLKPAASRKSPAKKSSKSKK